MNADKPVERYPEYFPAYYLVFLLLRKFFRQSKYRIIEKKARKAGPVGIEKDGPPRFYLGDKPFNPNHINKSAVWMDEDLNQPDIKKIASGIELVKKELTASGLRYTSAMASFTPRMYTYHTEKKNVWESTWCFYHANVQSRHKVLDVGGASTAFNFYLAKIGCDVSIVDNDGHNLGIIYNANYVAKKMNWNLRAFDFDAEKPLPFEDNHFDRIFSICVIGHLTSKGRRTLMREFGRVLKPGGIIAMSTDYDHKREVLMFDKGLRFGFPGKFFCDVINPSGCVLVGNQEMLDIDPEGQFLGAFFLQKSVK